ncbi:MAG: polyprenyl diphosphate synthase [Candidatus Diapherotrites archaeon]
MELNSIAFIPDGNRRYARLNGLNLLQAYSLGTQKSWDVLEWLVKYPQIKVGTFYTLSMENLSRNRAELSVLFKIFGRELDSVKDKAVLAENKIALKFVGRRELFPKKMQEKMDAAEKYTADFGGKRTINLALGYNGQQEIVDAAKKIAQGYKEGIVNLAHLNEKAFANYLYSPFQNPDLIIRTSGTQRLSGFLTYQSAYSELYFTPKYWPELQEADLQAAVKDFYERDRRYGK